MNHKSLQKLIEAADEADFYAVALYFLEASGYKNVRIVDGPYDGGRDVVCDRADLRIQLSVQKNWQTKVEKEAQTAFKAGKSVLIFVTNRRITPIARDKFFGTFSLAGKIEVVIHDSQSIASKLIRPSSLGRAFRILGIEVKPRLVTDRREIAVSSVLLFGGEAATLREEVLEAIVASWFSKHEFADEKFAIREIAKLISGADATRLAESTVSRMRTRGAVQGKSDKTFISEELRERHEGAELQLAAAKDADAQQLIRRFGISEGDAEELLELGINILLRRKSAGWNAAHEFDLKEKMSTLGLGHRTLEVMQSLAELDTISLLPKIETIDRLLSTNTFDIHRALGAKSEITLVLDASVALPMIFSLEFAEAHGRWSAAAMYLKRLADAHGFSLIVPRPYLNEMASHGLRALGFDEVYQQFSPELRRVMRESRNAYVSHYSRIVDHQGLLDGEPLSLREFLRHFGIKENVGIRRVEGEIESILETYGIKCEWGSRYDHGIRNEIEEKKPNKAGHIIEHDAAVCTSLLRQNDVGFILTTWDRTLIEIVQGHSRIYADSPGKVVDWLSFIQGIETGIDGSVTALEAFLAVEDASVARLASKLDQVESSEQAHKLTKIITATRDSMADKAWEPSIEELDELLDVELEDILHSKSSTDQDDDVSTPTP